MLRPATAPRCGGSRPIPANRSWTPRPKSGWRSPPPETAAGLSGSSRSAFPNATWLGEVGGALRHRDWLAENRRAFPPQRIGRFLIHGSHWHGAVPPSAIAIEIDAATAFGPGEHASTHGCLLALEALARRRRFRRPLDIGTGSGILAIAAGKRLHRRVIAGDIDPEAVRVARHHARRNGLAGRIRTVRAAGYRSRALRRSDYDLI